MTTAPITTSRNRTFTYRTSAEWLGRRNGRVAVSGKEGLVVSSPPEFRGEEGFLNPEELFVGAIESCLMLTFVSMVEKYHLPVEAYYSEASGILEHAEGQYRFTNITIKVTIIINDEEGSARVLDILEKANRTCLLTNSVRTAVNVEPELLLSAIE